MDVSIIICTRNRDENLAATLESFSRVRVPEGLSCELIVVDNGSTDHTRQIVEKASIPNAAVHCIFEEKKGLSNARNRGLEHAKGTAILWTDDDVRLPENWIEKMSAPLLSGDYDIVAGLAAFPEGYLDGYLHPEQEYFLPGDTKYIDPNAPQSAIGLNMAFHKRVFEKLRFDPKLGAGKLGVGEESMLCKQAVKMGFKITCVPDSLVIHYFDRARLVRSECLKNFKSLAESHAYVDFHLGIPTKPFMRLRYLKARLMLVFMRIIKKNDMARPYGLPKWEAYNICAIATYEFYFRMSRRGAEPD
jgi:glycosyltransferase involved in cell wall biosynthesis